MNFLLNRKTYRIALLLLCAILFQQHLFAQIEIFIVPNMDKSDTFTKMEPAAKRWFELNRKSDDKEDQKTYKSCKRSESSVIVVYQRTWVNRAGEGGADKPERVTEDPQEETTSIQIETIVPADRDIKPADQPKNAAATAVVQKQKEVSALKNKPPKDNSRSNFSPLANIPTPSPESMLARNARITEMELTFVDLTRNNTGKANISRFEAESAAILEHTFNFRLRALNPGEKGDYAVVSGKIEIDSTTVDLSGQTVDQMGMPAEKMQYFNLKNFNASITYHFGKKEVNFILLDVRNLSTKNKDDVKDFLIKNHSNNLHRLITIGF